MDKVDLDEEKLNELFDLLEYMCWRSCGDGDSYCISGKYDILADLFENWLKENSNINYERHEYESFVSFSSGMDSIAFYKNRSLLPTYSYNGEMGTFGDFVVEIVDGFI